MGQENGTLVGIAADVKGQATVTHADGTNEALTAGMPVYLDDTIETSPDGAVNITFNDNTVFAVSDNAKMVIDEFVYDPDADGEGKADVSVVRGAFAYTSGFIGKEDPSDVTIKTPVGSIGIRGTTIAGFVPEEGSGQDMKVTLIEGAIAVFPNGGGEFYMNQPMQTVEINSQTQTGQDIGLAEPQQVLENFNVLRSVTPQLFAPVVEGAIGAAPSPADAVSNPLQPQTEHMDEKPASDAAAPQDEPAPDSALSQTDQTTTQEAAVPQEPVPQEDQIAPEQNTLEISLTTDPLLSTSLQGPIMGPATGTLLPPPPGGDLINLSGLPGDPLLPPPLPPLQPLQPIDGTGTLTNTLGGAGDTNTVSYNPPANLAPVITIQPGAVFLAIEQGGLEGQTHSFDTKKFFSDPDGDPLHYSVQVTDASGNLFTGGVNPISSVSFTAAGNLLFTVGSIASDIDVRFSIKAIDDSGAASPAKVFDFTLFDAFTPASPAPTPGPDTITFSAGGPYKFSAGAGNDDITDGIVDGNAIFAGLGNDIVHINTSFNKVYGEIGDDDLYLSSGASNVLSGGAGSDKLIVDGTILSNNMLFGGEGNDLFSLNSSGATSLAANDLLIDAGSGFDTVKLVNFSGLVNFTGINNNKLHSIEKIYVDGANNTTVKINLDDILGHTDTKSLYIDLGTADSGDTLQVDVPVGTAAWTSIGTNFTDAEGSTGYTGYTNGGATLYVRGHASDTVSWV